jgi:hypothetical protein
LSDVGSDLSRFVDAIVASDRSTFDDLLAAHAELESGRTTP